MSDTQTPAQRVEKHADKRKQAGQVQVYVRAWVREGREDAARTAMREAASKYAEPNPPKTFLLKTE